MYCLIEIRILNSCLSVNCIFMLFARDDIVHCTFYKYGSFILFNYTSLITSVICFIVISILIKFIMVYCICVEGVIITYQCITISKILFIVRSLYTYSCIYYQSIFKITSIKLKPLSNINQYVLVHININRAFSVYG